MINKIKQFISRQAVHDVSLVYVGALLNGVSLFLINIFLGRALTKDLFGVFSLSILVLSTVAEMSDFGLNAGLLRFVPFYLRSGEENKLKQLIKTIWRWRIYLSLVLTVGGVVLSSVIAKYIFNRPEIASYVAVSFLGIGGVVLLGFTSTYLQAVSRFKYNAKLQALKGLLRLLLVLILVFVKIHAVLPYLIIYIVIPWLLFAVSYFVLPKNFQTVQVSPETKKTINSQLARFSFWLMIWSFAAIIASRIDQIMVSRLLGLEKVAVYAMAFQFIYLYSLAIQSVTAVLMPRINSLQNNQEVREFVKKIWRWLLPTAAVALLLLYPSQYLIQLILGSKYNESLLVYLILSGAMIISFVTIPFSLVITVFNQTKLVALSGLIQLLFNYFGNLFFIPQYGVMGAGFTFIIGVAFSLFFNWFWSVYLLRYKQIVIK
ncbi:MAG: oligosaccharide flippase family protein [Patescibacteria group bacterium]|nr:oligosaccharide flippase family protein [Patescibacteria group bacterium]